MKKVKALQYFTPESLAYGQKATPRQIAQFLEDFRNMQAQVSSSPSKLISIKIPEDLLNAFRFKAEASGVKYQTQIKKLMKDWLG